MVNKGKVILNVHPNKSSVTVKFLVCSVKVREVSGENGSVALHRRSRLHTNLDQESIVPGFIDN
jgi:hypothetical protein